LGSKSQLLQKPQFIGGSQIRIPLGHSFGTFALLHTLFTPFTHTTVG
jgi:hypothetical protein